MKLKRKIIFYTVLMFSGTFQLSAQNVITNVKENVVNVQDGTSSVNSGIVVNNETLATVGPALKGNGNIVSAAREIPAFESLSVKGSFYVDIKISSDVKNEIRISADSNLLDNVKTVVENGQLKIFSAETYSCSKKISIILETSSLNTLFTEGANNIGAGPLSSDIFTLKSPGGCNIISFAGKTRELQAQLGGASKLDAQQLAVENAVLNLSGASECMVNVKNSIKVKASGAAKVFYAGNPPEIIKELGGAAKVLSREPKNK